MTKSNECKKAFAVLLFCAATVMVAQAQTFTTILNFNGLQGSAPDLMSLVQGTDGNFYGTTSTGGAGFNCRDCGTVFKITPTGSLTVLYTFCNLGGCPDGEYPYAGLVLATDGNFYGTTSVGGVYGNGTVFKITPQGNLTILYSFCSQNCSDGSTPYAPLAEGNDGDLYGTTLYGGANGRGMVFKITLAGVLTVLHSFDGTDGQNPKGGLVLASDGNFYGTTSAGGTYNNGTVFRITPGGALSTLNMLAGNHGGNPSAGLIQAIDGDVYGTTQSGGYERDGTVFGMNLGGSFDRIYAFCSQPACADGTDPMAGVIQATDGNLYGTTEAGGANLDGTVYEITAPETLTTLHTFDGVDGQDPTGGLLQATNGNFYGTTKGGGSQSAGTVFSINAGLGPFVAFVHAAGKVGQIGGILGQGFTGTTEVLVNGVSTSFKIISDTFIEAKVPPGATTGYVTVQTPSGTLTSNVQFHVIP